MKICSYEIEKNRIVKHFFFCIYTVKSLNTMSAVENSIISKLINSKEKKNKEDNFVDIEL